MHHIYHTEGLILGSSEVGEDSRRFSIFTRDLGLVHARATGVRKLPSKLRFVLQDFSHVKIDLVQGKNHWRVTTASAGQELTGLVRQKEKFQVFINLARLLRRLMPAAEPNEKLFADIMQGLRILEGCGTKANLRDAEVVIVLRALHDLGYIGGQGLEHLINSPFEEELVFQMPAARTEALREINRALRESHL